MPKVDLICLANSYKLNHRCIAGLRADGNGWIRPVAGTGQGELEYRHYRLRDGSEPKPLDIIRIGLSTPRPARHQPENWQIDGSVWELIARPAGGESARIVVGSISETPLLFGNSGKSVPYAKNSIGSLRRNRSCWWSRAKSSGCILIKHACSST